MKKFLSMTMTLIMLMALAVPAFAVNKESDLNSEAEVQEEILESASEFAYLDADKATPELKEKILEARKEIIYNTDWVADGYVGCIRNIKHRLTRAHREKQLKMSCQALHNAPPNRT